MKKAPRLGCPLFPLAAGTLAGGAAQTVVAVAAAAQQDCQDDDPPNVDAAEAVAVTHNRYLRN